MKANKEVITLGAIFLAVAVTAPFHGAAAIDKQFNTFDGRVYGVYEQVNDKVLAAGRYLYNYGKT